MNFSHKGVAGAGAGFYSGSNTIQHVERYQYDAAGSMTHKGVAGTDADIRLVPNADDEIAQVEKHKTVTMIGTVDNTNAMLSLPVNGTDVVQDEHGNWVAPLVPMYPMSNGNVRIQLKAAVAGEPDTYKLADFSVFPTSTNLEYDANGSLLTLPAGGTAAPPSTLAWNAEGHLASVSSVYSVVQSFYDDNGRRIAKVENGALTLYLWDGMNIIGTADSAASLAEYYTRGIGIAGDVGTLVAAHSFTNGTTVLLHSNHRGDVVLATDSSGAAVYEAEYTPFGSILSQAGSYASRFGFSSKERDISGLVYYGFRYYSPGLCRWVSFDPITESGGINLYCFCFNNPVNYVDVLGLWFIWHGFWGGQGYTAGQVKPEDDLTAADMTVPPKDKRDKGYKGHDINICNDGHDYGDDLRLALDLLKVPPWRLEFWITSEGYPVPTVVESVLWATGVPGGVARLGQ